MRRNLLLAAQALALAFGLLLALPQGTKAAVAGDSLLVPYYYIGDRFYSKGLPLDKVTDACQNITLIRDNSGLRVTYVILKSYASIPEEWKAFEIPHEKVLHAEQLETAAKSAAEMMRTTYGTVDKSEVVGRPLPGDFNLKDLSGNTWTKDSLKGKVTVVNIWYSGCGPCRREMPTLSTWKEKYPQVLFLSADFEKADLVARIVKQHNFTWTHLVNDNYFVKWVGNEGFPTTIVIGADGRVADIFHGTRHDEILKAIDQEVNRATAASPTD